MMINTIPVSFLNKNKFKLFGILHKPSENINKDLGIIFLTPGIKNRVAPHRLYLKLARHLSEQGFQLLRMDPHGMGDSEGEVPESRMVDYFAGIQTGKYVEDAISSMNWMKQTCGCNYFILFGLCGGAITALLTAWKDQRVKGLISLGVPVLMERGNENYFKIMSTKALQHHYEGYVKKIFSLKAWMRFLSFQSTYRVVAKSFINRLLPGIYSHKSNIKKQTPQNMETFNPYFLPAFQSIVSSSRKILFLYGGKDRLYWEFDEKFMVPNKHHYEKYSSNYELYIVKNARHIYEFIEQQQELFFKVSSWLFKNFQDIKK